MGLGVGPWLRSLKDAVVRGAPDDTVFDTVWRESGAVCEARVRLGEVRDIVLCIVPGQKVAYVVDTVYSEDNAARIATLARDADILFIEAVFLDADSERTRDRFHLTARQAGTLGRCAGARRIVPSHFSQRYDGQADVLLREADQAFVGADVTG